MSIEKTWLEALKADGGRDSTPRQSIVRILSQTERLLEPMEIFLEARRACPHLGLVTVYRTLEKLEKLSLIQRVHTKNGCHAYIAMAPDHQHLLICESCKRSEWIPAEDFAPIQAKLESLHQYRITDHWLQIMGICRECQNKEGKHEK